MGLPVGLSRWAAIQPLSGTCTFSNGTVLDGHVRPQWTVIGRWLGLRHKKIVFVTDSNVTTWVASHSVRKARLNINCIDLTIRCLQYYNITSKLTILRFITHHDFGRVNVMTTFIVAFCRKNLLTSYLNRQLIYLPLTLEENACRCLIHCMQLVHTCCVCTVRNWLPLDGKNVMQKEVLVCKL